MIPFYITVATTIMAVYIFNDDMTSNTGDSGLFLLNRNAVAMFIFTFAVIPTILKYSRGEKINFSDITNLGILVFAQSLTQSRAGLLIALLYLVFTICTLIINRYRTTKLATHEIQIPKNKKIIISIGIILLILILFYLIKDSRLIHDGLSSSGRVAIYRSYFEELTVQKLIFGFEPSLYKANTHMHNSFIELLVTSGIIGALPIFIVLIITCKKLISKSFNLTLIFSLLMLYSMVEFYTLFLYGDFALIPLILIAGDQKKRKQ
jgi:hypothetical protein